LSGSVEGVMSDHDSYSDSEEAMHRGCAFRISPEAQDVNQAWAGRGEAVSGYVRATWRISY
jgi:hypothetical protein